MSIAFLLSLLIAMAEQVEVDSSSETLAQTEVLQSPLRGALIMAQPPQEPDDPAIPNWGGAIKFKEPQAVNDLPHALDAGWQGERVCELLFENEDIRALRCVFPPGAGHEKHFHPAHFGYILEGGVMKITDADGTREQETPAGASWWSDGVAWHEAVNIGETTTAYIIIEPKDRGE